MTKINQTSELTVKMLAPLKDWCERTEGGMKIVQELYNKNLGKKVHHGNIYRWLSKKGTKVYEPQAGALLRLLECWQAIRGQDVVNKPTQSIWCAANGHVANHAGLKCKVCECQL